MKFKFKPLFIVATCMNKLIIQALASFINQNVLYSRDLIKSNNILMSFSPGVIGGHYIIGIIHQFVFDRRRFVP